jgi:signal transduction histidine kinase
MNKRNIDTEIARKITDKMLKQTILVLITCFITVFFMKFIADGYVVTSETFLFAGGIFIPLVIVITISNYFTFNKTYKQFVDLANGLEKAVEGDFYAKLDPTNAGMMEKVYQNFNKVTDELKNVRNMQEEFVSNYSHELRTPISSIKGFSELLLKEDLSDEERRKYLKIISESADRLNNLAEESILITKLDSQEILEKEEYSLSEQLRNCIIMLEPLWSAKNIDLNIDINEIKYNGNKEIMGHLWTNLISNSIKYNKENGKINVTLKENENQIIATISDTGIGMTEEQISHIFEKYYQVEKSKTMKGLGLGLTIVSRILCLINGDIEVKSELGHGSTFMVTIPK